MADKSNADVNELTDNLNADHGKKPASKPTPKNGDETRTLSSQFPGKGFEILDALGDTLHSDRAATIRWCIAFTLRQIANADGTFTISQKDVDYVPHANMVEYCLTGVNWRK
jgi:hypothetical protein